MKSSKLFASLALLAFAVAPAQAQLLVGNDVSTGRANASDGDGTIFQVDRGDPIPETGFVTDFVIYDQAGNNSSTDWLFHAYILRPTGTANEYTVISDNLLTPTGTNTTKYYDVTDIPVQAGDLIAHYGRGVPFTDGQAGGDYEPIFYPSPNAPAQGDTIVLGSTAYPTSGYVRDYAFAANFVVPEPASLSLMAIGGLALLRRRRA